MSSSQRPRKATKQLPQGTRSAVAERLSSERMTQAPAAQLDRIKGQPLILGQKSPLSGGAARRKAAQTREIPSVESPTAIPSFRSGTKTRQMPSRNMASGIVRETRPSGAKIAVAQEVGETEIGLGENMVKAPKSRKSSAAQVQSY